MLEWIAGFVDRWAPVVSTAARDLVHWGLHALAGVVYTVFGHVGAAWLSVWDSIKWHLKWADAFVRAVIAHIDTIVTKDIPWIWAYFLSQVKQAALNLLHNIEKVTAYAFGLYQRAIRAIDDLNNWINTHVLLPLNGDVAQLRKDLLKWGFFAYQLLNDPGKLATLLAEAMVSALLAIFWKVATPVGKFIIGIILKDTKRFVQLAETILSAVL